MKIISHIVSPVILNPTDVSFITNTLSLFFISKVKPIFNFEISTNYNFVSDMGLKIPLFMARVFLVVAYPAIYIGWVNQMKNSWVKVQTILD